MYRSCVLECGHTIQSPGPQGLLCWGIATSDALDLNDTNQSEDLHANLPSKQRARQQQQPCERSWVGRDEDHEGLGRNQDRGIHSRNAAIDKLQQLTAQEKTLMLTLNPTRLLQQGIRLCS